MGDPLHLQSDPPPEPEDTETAPESQVVKREAARHSIVDLLKTEAIRLESDSKVKAALEALEKED